MSDEMGIEERLGSKFLTVRGQRLMVRQDEGGGWMAFRVNRNGMSGRYDKPESAVYAIMGDLTRQRYTQTTRVDRVARHVPKVKRRRAARVARRVGRA
jgi:hypothetical protein